MIDDVVKTPGKCPSSSLPTFLLQSNQPMSSVPLPVVVFIALQDEHLSQILSNILQVKERGATTIVLSNLADISSVIDPIKIDFLIKLDPA